MYVLFTTGDEGKAAASLWYWPPSLQPHPPSSCDHTDPAAG